MKKKIKFSTVSRLISSEYTVQNYLKIKEKLNYVREVIQFREQEFIHVKDLAPDEAEFIYNRLSELHEEEKALESVLVNAPPDPILLPPAPLLKVIGVIEQFNQRCVKHYFDSKAYPKTYEYFRKQEKRIESAALVMAIAGSSTTAQGMLSDENRTPCNAWYVTGYINGKRFSGWLGSPFCQDGEEVELIVSPVDDEYLVYAVHKPWERSVIMPVNCYRGKLRAQKAAMCIPVGVVLFGEIMLLIYALMNNEFQNTSNPLEPFVVFFIVALFVCLLPAFWSIWYRRPFPQEELSEEIFTVLGWKNVAEISLCQLNKMRKQEWERTGTPRNPFKNYSPFKSSGYGYNFYYY